MPSWGELRLNLQTQFPEVSLDIIDSALRERYSTVLSATDWTGLEGHASIQTTAAYQSTTDTVTLTVGARTVFGIGTAWTAPNVTGMRFYRPGDTVNYLATWISATALALDRPYEGNGSDAAGALLTACPYVFMQNLYPLPDDARSIRTVENPITGLPMKPFSELGLDRSAGQRTLVGYPHAWAEYDDTPETDPPVLHQVELFPPPLQARGFPLYYLRNPRVFNGENTSDAPLPFVTATVLLAGARADIATYRERMAQAVKYETAFEKELARMLLLEHAQKRVKTSVHMDPRYTRHRLARASRGQYSTWRGGQPGGPS
jgi:hypothetical protein